MKKAVSLLLALLMCLSLCACGGGSSTTPETTEAPDAAGYAIGESFGTDSVECVVTEVRWVTLEDVTSHPAARDVLDTNYQHYTALNASDMFPGYSFYGVSGFSSKSTKYPYLCVTFTLQNVGKELIEPEISSSGWEFVPYGNIAVLYDDGYTFESKEGFATTLEVLGDAFCEGRVFDLPSQVFENADKALKVQITLPNSQGEAETFVVTVR